MSETRRLDVSSVRRTNLGLVLRELRVAGPRSRAALAAELGFNRSTTSALVADLADRGLVRDGGLERGTIGRPGTSVEIDGRCVVGIGAELNVNHVSTRALDLRGTVVGERRWGLDAAAMRASDVVDRLAELVAATRAEVERRGARVVGVTVGVAGLVDRERGVLTRAPNLPWRDLPLAGLLRERVGPDIPIEVDNEGNLAAVAEVAPWDQGRQDLLVLFGEVGVGGGIVADGRLLRGRHGSAGELGHITVDARGRPCGCGRYGCWETVIGLRALLRLAAEGDDPVQDPRLPIDLRLAEIGRRAAAGDSRVLAALRQVGFWIGVGAVTLVNAIDPAAVVLSGTFAPIGDFLRPAVEDGLRAGVHGPGRTDVVVSALGLSGAVQGGALLALEAVFENPTLIRRSGSQTVTG